MQKLPSKHSLPLNYVKSETGALYEITKTLARGGFSSVSLVERFILDGDKKSSIAKSPNSAAIKTSSSKFQNDLSILLIENEISILPSLNHPSIIKFYGRISEGSSSSDGYLMEHVQIFQNLRNFSQKLISLEFVLLAFQTIALGLDYLHKHDLIHGDIKPDNLLVPKNPKYAKLADFGYCSQNGSRIGSFMPQDYSTSSFLYS